MARRFGLVVVWWIWMPLAAWLVWAVLHYVFGGVGTWEQWWRLTVVRSWWLPGGGLGHGTALFWLWVAVGLFGSGFILGVEDVPEAAGVAAGSIAAVAGVVVLAYPLPVALWDNDKDAGKFYNESTVFHDTKGGAVPSSLSYLLNDARGASGGCDARGRHDVPSCIKHDQLEGIRSFEGRGSSFASALSMMQHAGSPAPKTDAWEPTLTYIYGERPGQDGLWTAVLDGSGKATPVYGIATWDGRTNNVQVGCRFNTGKGDRFNRAFAGQRGNSLRNLLAEKYPDYWYDDGDVWGYCEGTRPVIVVQVKKQKAIGSRTVVTAAGVLTLRGGEHEIKLDHRERVAPGDLPGPVYPSSLAEEQRDQTVWAAGRKWKQRASFGYKPASDDVQAGNDSEYLLRGPDRRLYYVTPLSPNESRSEAFIAYAVSPADSTESGRLNRMDVYVLPDGDKRVANLNTLVNRATDAVRGADPTFLNTGGKLEEFTPLGGDMWRVFGVRRGITEFYVDLSSIGRAAPRTVNVAGSAPGKAPEAAACGKAPSSMSSTEIAACLTALGGELQRRQGGK